MSEISAKNISTYHSTFNRTDSSSLVATSMADDNEYVNLNVGGHHFTTTIATLTRVKESMLGAMFSGRYALQPNSNGEIVIDRDGTHFRHILNFLRDQPTFSVEHLSKSDLVELRREAEYYGLDKVMFTPPASRREDTQWNNCDGIQIKLNRDGLWYGRNRSAPWEGGLLVYCTNCFGAWIRDSKWIVIKEFCRPRSVSAKQPKVGPLHCPACRNLPL